jgi:hypothetical protein
MRGIWILSLICLLIVFGTRVGAEGDVQVAMLQKIDVEFYSSVKGTIDVPDPLLKLAPLMTEDASKTPEYLRNRGAKLQSIVKSISAVEDREVGLTDADKLVIADAALSAQEQTGVDAIFMVALARMESDFKKVTQVNAWCKAGLQTQGCYADCGMTQHHIRGPAKYVKTRCKQLAENVKEVFLLSATEISSHVSWCLARAHQAWYRPMRQCVLNRYNMGPYYKTADTCRKQYNCSSLRVDLQRETYDEFAKILSRCKAQERKCLVKAAYWERVTCFEYGARKQLRSTKNCRWCMNVQHIQSFFYRGAQEPAGVANQDVAPQPTVRGPTQ